MSTCLYTTSLLDGFDFYGTARIDRTFRYMDWYLEIQNEIGFDEIHLADNASNIFSMQLFFNYYYASGAETTVTIHNLPRLEREGGGKEHDYPFCWRGIYFMRELIKLGFEKIINIDTDGFVLNSRMAKAIKDCNSGWVTWTPNEFYFPENAINILNKDAFHVLEKFCETPMHERFGKILELELPFTEVRKDFNVYRWGQKFEKQREDMDFYAQANHKVELKFKRGV